MSKSTRRTTGFEWIFLLLFRFQTNIYGFWFVCQLCCVLNRLCLSYKFVRDTQPKNWFQNTEFEITYENISDVAAAFSVGLVHSFCWIWFYSVPWYSFFLWFRKVYTAVLHIISRYIISTNEKKILNFVLYRNEMKWIINMQHFFLNAMDVILLLYAIGILRYVLPSTYRVYVNAFLCCFFSLSRFVHLNKQVENLCKF